MALFKVCRGNEANLPSTINDGWAYFCTDTGNFYIDWVDTSNSLYRVQINAKCADSLRYLSDDEYVELTATDICKLIDDKADAEHTHNYAGSSSVGGSANSAVKLETARKINGVAFDGTKNIDIVSISGVAATSSDGVAYTATVPGITTLVSGISFIMIPSIANASTVPTLNVNGLGAKMIGRYMSSNTKEAYKLKEACFVAEKPIRVTYDGMYWIVDIALLDAQDLIGGAPNQNLLDNWYFIDPINQRGTTSLSETGYIIDRWLFSVWSSVSPNVRYQSDYGLVLTCSAEAGDTNSTYIKQTIENPAQFAGKTVTLSARLKWAEVDGDPILLIYSKGASAAEKHYKITADDSGRTVSVTTTLADDITTLYVGIGNFSNHGGDGSFTLGIESMKLEIGGVSTLNYDAPPKKSEQLLECQRYYVKFTGYHAFPGYKSTTPYAFVQLPVPLRKLNTDETVSLTFNESGNYFYCANGTRYPITYSSNYNQSNVSGTGVTNNGGNNLRIVFNDGSNSSICPNYTGYNFVCQNLEISVEI